MIVLGFLAALFMMRRLSRRARLSPAMITNAALYSLVIGVVGARAFFVVHYFEQFREEPLNIFATWHGGLEFLGGVIPAVGFLLFYLHHHKLPVRRYLDIMAIGLMMGLAFGRIISAAPQQKQLSPKRVSCSGLMSRRRLRLREPRLLRPRLQPAG